MSGKSETTPPSAVEAARAAASVAMWERGYLEGVAAGRRDMTRDVLVSAKTMTRTMLISWLEAEQVQQGAKSHG